MKKWRIILLFISTLSVANNNYEINTNKEIINLKNEIEKLKKEKENSENIKYDGLDVNVRKEIDEYTLNMSQKMDLIKDKIKTRYKLGKYQTAGESFLESLEENENKFKVGIVNKTMVNKELHKNNSDIYFIKKINNDGNNFGVGVYGGYVNTKYKQYTGNDLHGFDLGVILEAELPEYGLNLVSMNEFNKDFKINSEYTSNSIVGGVSLAYKKQFGSLFYVEPMAFMLYGSNISSKLKFNDTDVNVKNNFMYSAGGNIKLGLEKELNNNSYNLFLETTFDKKIKKDNNLIFKFKDKERYSVVPLQNDINLDLGLGFDALLNKSHRLHLDSSIGLIPSDKIYKIGILYELLK
ncbi:hypothetical protein HP397_00760 [Streptobacillus felis]|uniref:Autotransporter domain-containing protein n=1 Tax=Streptobacillus felis TaxID=1384509 RepID=A0A7Z0PDW0_9FUSO|nr:autotransporter outer membrane beta-barrel domain-containing protein [Streptobacillus felis]NYV27357.1 hypothetical protein [Streptobacillus felis]